MKKDKAQTANRKTEYSVKVIKGAFIELLMQQPFEKITVTAVCQAADVNRSTFYANFIDIYDLAEAIDNDLFDRLYNPIEKFGIMDEHQFYKELLNDIKDSYPLSEAVTKLPHPKALVRLQAILHDKVFSAAMKKVSPDFVKIVHEYASSGFSSVISDWIDKGMACDLDSMAEYLCQLNRACANLVCTPKNEKN